MMRPLFSFAKGCVMFTVHPTEIVLKYAPWSVSKADKAKQCPLAFKFTYVDKHKGPDNPDALVGKALHSILEYSIMGTPVTDAVDKVMETYKLTSSEMDRVMDLAPTVDSFKRKFAHYCRTHGTARPQVEQKLSIDRNGKPVRFFDNKNGFFRGAIDVAVLFNNRPYALALDHKTGKLRALEYYKNQMDAYAMLLKAHNLKLEKVMPSIHWLQANHIEMGKFMAVDDLVKMIDALVHRLNEDTAGLEDLDKHNVTPLCGWCPHQDRCPAHK